LTGATGGFGSTTGTIWANTTCPNGNVNPGPGPC